MRQRQLILTMTCLLRTVTVGGRQPAGQPQGPAVNADQVFKQWDRDGMAG